MITHDNTVTLEDGHVAIVLTDESVKLVTPEPQSDEDGTHIVDTPQMQMAMAVALLMMSDKDWMVETMDRFEEQMRALPPAAKH